MLSVDDYGLLAGFMSAITIIAVSTSALQTAAAKAVAVGENEPAEPRYLDQLTRTAIVAGVVFAVATATAAPLLSDVFRIGVVPIFVLGAYAIPSSLDSIAAGRFQGARRFRSLATYSACQALAKLGLATVLVAVGLRVGGLIAGLAISSAVVSIAGLRRTRDVGAIRAHVLGADVRRGFLAFLMLWVMVSVDLLFARAKFGSHEAGVYAAAAVLGKAVLWLPAVVTQIVFPHLAEQSSKDEESGGVLTKAALLIAGISGAAVLGLFLLGGPVFTLLYGGRYDGADAIAWKIGLAMLPLAMVNLLLFHYIARGANRFLAWMGFGVFGETIAFAIAPASGTSYAVVMGAVGLSVLMLIGPGAVVTGPRVSGWARRSR
jgi:O-antigen/teichoic acid export membrane protein